MVQIKSLGFFQLGKKLLSRGRGLSAVGVSTFQERYKARLDRTLSRKERSEMYSQPSSTMTLHRRESFASSRLSNRSTEPEIFTFEQIHTQATAVPSYVPIRAKKRCTRVMYPAKVRMHLPPPEKSPAKRWLLVLILVVLWQIYTEEPCVDTPPSGAHVPAGDYQAFAARTAAPAAATSYCEADAPVEPSAVHDRTGPAGGQQGAGNSYMVALLVYHRLGSDK
ncbi:radiation-inducible immediate-early gene IEX-1 [Dunckerocampus dactyliophorus]|uniref:radiation-inducible immediate-early gene IEX-1 n=1 Tax=Dunckerocampus dactyliophorus TaxID=161453 RepID=UPI002405A338|nr:radiation-inducible immediate-early gene IEX-1 [Dunckerocampus dactyliophorus]